MPNHPVHRWSLLLPETHLFAGKASRINPQRLNGNGHGAGDFSGFSTGDGWGVNIIIGEMDGDGKTHWGNNI